MKSNRRVGIIVGMFAVMLLLLFRCSAPLAARAPSSAALASGFVPLTISALPPPTPDISPGECDPYGTGDPRPQLPVLDDAAARWAMEALDDLQEVRPATRYRAQLFEVWGEGEWAVGEVGLVDAAGLVVPSDGDVIAAAKQADGRWVAYRKGSDGFNRILLTIPSPWLSASAKQLLYAPDRADGPTQDSTGIYRLPFGCNQRAYTTQVHADATQRYDIDFSIQGTDIVAARDGWIAQIQESHSECCYSSGCGSCNNYVVIDHGDGEYSYYLHIAQDSVPDSLKIGSYVSRGTMIARQGDVGWTGGNGRSPAPCNGNTSSQKCGAHLHFGVHKGRYWNSTTVRPRFDDVQGTYAIAGSTYASGNCSNPPQPCSAPTLLSPAEGALLTSPTNTFRWSVVSGCVFNGYAFRVKDIANMDSGGAPIIETDVSATQHSATITGHDNQTLYWGVRAANASDGAAWSVRSFRIQPACHALTCTHTNAGSDPIASPVNSVGCPPGQYLAGMSIALSAGPASGWRVGSWNGTDDDSSLSTTNHLTMPAGEHTVTVHYAVLAEPTVTATPAPTPSPTPDPGSFLSCPPAPTGLALDGYLTEWAGRPVLHVNKERASYCLCAPQLSEADLAGDIYCAWQGNDLIFAGQVFDDVLRRDSVYVWDDDGIELGLDGLGDGFDWGSRDDHQFTVVTDGAVRDLGAATGALAVARVMNGGWWVEVRVPAGLLNIGDLYPGRSIRFNVGLNDDDDGGARDAWLVWRGTSTFGKSQNFGALVLSGSPSAPTPTSTSTATPAPTIVSTATASATCTPPASLTYLPLIMRR
jgi:murein DD-endopeptidase MepM/ murein hydrolase activator NlpD